MDKKITELLEKIEKLNSELKNEIPNEYKEVLGDVPRFNFSQISKNVGHLLYDLVSKNNKKTILELGTSAGYSTIWLGTAAKKTNGAVATIEKDPKKIYFAKKHISESGLDNIKLIEGDIIESLKTWNTKIDFLFIDAEKSRYLDYFKLIEKFLKKEAIIVADNIKTITEGNVSVESKTKPYVDYITSKKEYENEMIELDNGLLLSQML